MAEVRWIRNLKGILYYLDVPILDFEISERNLIKAVDLSKKKFFPPELATWGISYGNINSFFVRRTMQEGCMMYHDHLKEMGMENFDFDRYIMMKNGNNHLDNYWVKFERFGAKSFRDICEQEYPVC